MKAVIYYFSSTGNSWLIATRLAAKLQGRTVHIAALRNETRIVPQENIVGLVFPVYFATNGESGLPRMVESFIKKLEGLDGRYVFAAATYDGIAGMTVVNCVRLVKQQGGRLAAGFTMKILSNTPTVSEKMAQFLLKKPFTAIDPAVLKLSSGWPAHQEEWNGKIDRICRIVQNKVSGIYETRGWWSRLLWMPLTAMERVMFRQRWEKLSGKRGRPFAELVAFADNGLAVGPACNGCGTCARVCPAGNIVIENRRPVRLHRCENCMGCYHWCPKNAVGGPLVEFNPRYHHPDVASSDLQH